jgi:4-hydroxy-2-oxoheptanedioate aldolase
VNGDLIGDRLRRGETVFGVWSILAGAATATVLASAASGLDYAVIDLQHGAATEHDLPGMTAAISLAGVAPLARVRHAHPADIGRALDLGCHGVIVPNVDSAQQAAEMAGACRYPPAGYRSAGGALAVTTRPLCLVMVESAAALAELDSTLALDGVDGVYVGPRDLSFSLGCALDPADPVLRPALERVWAASTAAGKPAGVHATDGATARLYREAGCRVVTVAVDAVALSRGAAADLSTAQS